MNLDSEVSCRAYVEDQLTQLGRMHPDWRASESPDWHETSRPHPAGRLAWSITRARMKGWYTLEGRLDQGEFVVWFGNHRVGVGGVHWIMRPAVHVAFTDVMPRSDPVALPYTLCDVLDQMMATVDGACLAPRFELNDFSIT